MAFITTTANSISSGGTISGDITIEGDLTVNGDGAGNYDEIINGNLEISDTLRLNPTISSGSATTLAFMRSGTNKWRFLQPHDDSYLKLYNDGASATQMYFKSDNTIGIETNTPFAVKPDGSTTNISGLQITNSTSGEDAVLSLRNDNNTQGLDIWSDTNAGTAYIDNIFDGAGADINFRVRTLGTTIHAMTIDGAGKVAIGSTDPTAGTLLVSHATDSSIVIQSAADSGSDASLFFKVASGTADENKKAGIVFRDTGTNGIGDLYFLNDSATDGNNATVADNTAMVIKSGGDIGVGTSSPVAKMDILGDRTINITNTIADDTNKNAVITHSQYDSGTETEGFMMMQGFSNSSTNKVSIGGGNSQHNAVEEINFWTAGDSTTRTGTERMIINNAGNVSIGVTPETSHSSVINLQIGGLANVMATSAQSAGGSTWLGNNVYINSSGAQAHIVTDEASVYRQVGGTHNFQTVASGSADASISFTTNMVLDINSRISLGNNDGGADNTVFGELAGNALTTNGDENVLIGHDSGKLINTGEKNVVIGSEAGDAMTIATRSVAIGSRALGAEDVGDRSIAIGFAALSSQNTSSDNTTTGNVGIGIETGFYNVTGQYNTLLGTGAGFGVSGNSHSYNTAVGYSSMNSVTTGSSNVGVGFNSLKDSTTGTQNVSVGTGASQGLTTGLANVSMGFQSMFTPTTVAYSVAVGSESMRDIPANRAISYSTSVGYAAFKGNASTTTGANYTTAIGHQALFDLQTGGSNVAVGALCAENITTGAENTAVGTSAMRNSTTANNNTAIGRQAMGSGVTTGTDNTAVGKNSGLAITSSQYNTLVGSDSGQSITTGWNSVMVGYATGDATVDSHKHTLVGAGACGNADLTTDGAVAVGYTALADLTVGTCVGVGFEAGKDNSTGGNNVFVGYKAGNSGSNDVTDGQANTIIGSEATAGASGAINRTAIGRTTVAVADNSVTLGNATVSAVYMAQDSGATVYANGLAIGQPSPTVPVHIKEDTSVDDAQLKVEQDGSGDAGIAFLLTGVKGYAMGIDNSHANDALIIGGNDDAIGTTPYLTINPSDSTVTGDLVDSSDIAFKENVQTLADGIGVVSKLNPVSFDWKDEGKGSNSGFIAQEIEKILPNDVSGEDYDAKTSVNGKAINVTGIVAHLVKAVQELTAKVEALEKK